MRLPWKTFLVGGAVAAGATARYFLDPEQGLTRRVRTRDQVASRVRSAGRKLEDEMAVQRKRTQDRLAGMTHEATRDPAADTAPPGTPAPSMPAAEETSPSER